MDAGLELKKIIQNVPADVEMHEYLQNSTEYAIACENLIAILMRYGK